MDPRELTLHIAVNLGRIGRWAADGTPQRIDSFLEETGQYLGELRASEVSDLFRQTLDRFTAEFEALQSAPQRDEAWAERAFTWANILTHRAVLA